MKVKDTYLKGILICSLLLNTILLAALLPLVFSPPTSPPVYLDDIPSTASYVIKKDSSNYYWAVAANGSMPWAKSTNASQIIINSITSGGSVLITAGTYTTQNTIKKSVNNVLLEGQGNATVLRLADSKSINVINVTSVSGWTIRNLQIDGNKAGQTWGGSLNNQNGIFIGSDSSTSSAFDVTIENVYIHDTMGNGIAVRGSNVRRTLIQGNHISSTPRNGIVSMLAKDLIVTNNFIVNCGSVVDINNKWHAIYTYGENHIISNNKIYGGGGDGIEVYGLINGTITGNIINDVGRSGIYLQQNSLVPNKISVTGNTIINPGRNATVFGGWRFGIYVVTPYSTITGNTITGAGASGIYLASYAYYTTVTGNSIFNSSTTGISLYDLHHVTVSGNTLAFNSGMGISLDHANFTTISGNTLTANAHGIYLDTSYYNGIVGNTVDGVGVASDYGFREINSGNNGYNSVVATNVYNTSYGIQFNSTTEGATKSRVTACYNGTSWVATWGSG